MSDTDATRVLNELLDTLDAKMSSGGEQGHADAISGILAAEPRQTAVTSLHDSPVVESFRQAMADGFIRVDTANRLLRLINEIIVRFVP